MLASDAASNRVVDPGTTEPTDGATLCSTSVSNGIGWQEPVAEAPAQSSPYQPTAPVAVSAMPNPYSVATGFTTWIVSVSGGPTVHECRKSCPVPSLVVNVQTSV